ncbi:S9 family peptidase [SAR86 cluster bacterium]|nr:S9 family peptidase [SAR86 cluster bacterium]
MNKPPVPKKIPKKLESHNDIRIDDYYWLRDDERKNKEIISYLEDENKYTDNWFAERKDYKTEIYNEMLSRIPEKETSMKVKKDDYFYFSEIFSNEQYSRYFREKDGYERELLLDLNEISKGEDYFSISGISPSPNHSFIAYGEDLSGRREFNLKIKDLSSKKVIDSNVFNSSGNIVWDNNNKFIFYTKKDPKTLITNKVYKHKIGDKQEKDQLIYEEQDPEFNLGISKSRMKNYLSINIGKTESSETWFLDLKDKSAKPICFLKRKDNHLYSVTENDDCFYILTNMNDCKNFKLVKSKIIIPNNSSNWETIIEHSEDTYLEGIDTFKKYFYLEVREDGLPKIKKFNKDDLSSVYINFNDPAYSAYLAGSYDYESEEVFYGYSSPNCPSTIYKENHETNKREEVWMQDLKNFDASLYESERLKVVVRDKTKVPVSLVYKKGIDLKNSPMLVYGYGSYGAIIDAAFRTSIIPLLDRGFIFAIAHIRGGSEMGRKWYDDGKMQKKMNTFFDFIDVTKSLTNLNYGNKEQLFAMGGSAGGLLMGAVINLEPELYKGIISAVPFVDVLTTMSDESIPLTTFEYKEWGNPANEEEYNYMKQYSPYDNIKPLNYPSVLVTSSLHDSQVQYFEPAKYVPKLRENSTSENPVLLKMNLIGGHAGKSGRLNSLEESSFDNSFLLCLLDE